MSGGTHMAEPQRMTSASTFPLWPKLVCTGLLSPVTKDVLIQEGRDWTEEPETVG